VGVGNGGGGGCGGYKNIQSFLALLASPIDARTKTADGVQQSAGLAAHSQNKVFKYI
jgi:hypothetical protein